MDTSSHTGALSDRPKFPPAPARLPRGSLRTAAGRLHRTARHRAAWLLARLLPLPVLYALACLHGRREYRRRRPGLEPQAAEMAALLGAGADQVDACLRRHFELRACELVDWHVIPARRGAGMRRLIEIGGLEHLTAALGRGRGAILYSGHVTGDWTLFAALAARGLPVNMMGRFIDSPDRLAAARLSEFMEERLGVRFLQICEGDPGIAVCARNALAGNAVVTIEIDQSMAMQRVEARFLGRQAWFPRGLVEIARSSSAPLLPFWVRRPAGRAPQSAEIGEPAYVTKDTEAAIQRCATEIGRAVIGDPESWRAWTFSRMLVWRAAHELREP